MPLPHTASHHIKHLGPGHSLHDGLIKGSVDQILKLSWLERKAHGVGFNIRGESFKMVTTRQGTKYKDKSKFFFIYLFIFYLFPLNDGEYDPWVPTVVRHLYKLWLSSLVCHYDTWYTCYMSWQPRNSSHHTSHHLEQLLKVFFAIRDCFFSFWYITLPFLQILLTEMKERCS